MGDPTPLLQDLKVSIKESSLIFPSQETKRRSLFLTNIDQVLNFSVETVHFFPPHSDFPPQVVTERIKTSFSQLLVAYDLLAGRLKICPQNETNNGRLEIDCNGAGAGFVVASSGYSLDEIGDLVYPNPAFQHLVSKSLDGLEPDDHPLAILQVTSFNCGGFAMGFSTNHSTLDGLSFKMLLENFAALAGNRALAVTPCHDRHLLAARSPPRVTFSHHELLKLDNPLPSPNSLNAPVFEATPEDLELKIFKLTAMDITALKHKAQPTTSLSKDGGKNRCISSFNVVTALVWRCKALSFDTENNHERPSTLLYAVDIRSRLNPPLPKSYCGNAVLTVYATAKCKELEEEPFSRVVEMVAEAAARMTDEYARSTIDWGELYKGFPNGELLVSSWWRLGFADVEYPWGKPRYSCPVMYHRKDIILLFPDINGSGKSSGVNVLVALPTKEMEKFQTLFQEFMA